jgi:hypothetical protein
MAPLFDNGTSLGYEIAEKNLRSAAASAALNAYVRKGTHHCGFDKDGPAPHMDVCANFLRAHEIAGFEFQNVIRFSREQISSILAECVQFEVGIAFSRERADWVEHLLEARKKALAALLEG